MSLFHKSGYVCRLERDQGEPLEHFTERGIFVVSQKPKTTEEYENAVLHSRLYSKMKHDGCQYGPKLLSITEEMEKKVWRV